MFKDATPENSKGLRQRVEADALDMDAITQELEESLTLYLFWKGKNSLTAELWCERVRETFRESLNQENNPYLREHYLSQVVKVLQAQELDTHFLNPLMSQLHRELNPDAAEELEVVEAHTEVSDASLIKDLTLKDLTLQGIIDDVITGFLERRGGEDALNARDREMLKNFREVSQRWRNASLTEQQRDKASEELLALLPYMDSLSSPEEEELAEEKENSNQDPSAALEMTNVEDSENTEAPSENGEDAQQVFSHEEEQGDTEERETQSMLDEAMEGEDDSPETVVSTEKYLTLLNEYRARCEKVRSKPKQPNSQEQKALEDLLSECYGLCEEPVEPGNRQAHLTVLRKKVHTAELFPELRHLQKHVVQLQNIVEKYRDKPQYVGLPLYSREIVQYAQRLLQRFREEQKNLSEVPWSDQHQKLLSDTHRFYKNIAAGCDDPYCPQMDMTPKTTRRAPTPVYTPQSIEYPRVDRKATAAAKTHPEHFTLQQLEGLSLPEAVILWEKYHEECERVVEDSTRLASGLRGFLGITVGGKEERMVPSQRAKILSKWRSELSSEREDQFRIYVEAQHSGASQKVLDAAAAAYQRLCEREKQQKLEETAARQAAIDAQFLERISSSENNDNPLAL